MSITTMPLPSSLLLHLVSLHIILFLTGKTCSQSTPTLSYCSGDNHTSPSSFETNLHLLLSNLTIATANSPSFFSTYTVGSPESFQIFGLAQCRLDISPIICGSCLGGVSVMSRPNQLGGCGRNNSAAFRYDNCFLRYSDVPFFGILEMSVVAMFSDKVNTSNIPGFGNRVQGLIKEISPAAATSEFRYAVSAVNSSGFETNIYGLAWCTMDLMSTDCLRCLNLALPDLNTEWTGGEVAMVSCTVRFSTVQFYSVPIFATPPPASTPFGFNLREKNTTSLSIGQKKISTKTILIGVLSGSLALIVIFIILLIVLRRRRRDPIPPLIISTLPQSASRHSKDLMRSIESLLLNLDAIRTATKDFSKENKLGEGGFGVVYKGVLEDGQEIAVKRLSITSKQGLKQLKTEVVFMAKLQHRNLVKLLGCCLKDEEKLLVYEYLPNNSLDKYLSDAVRRMQLDWRRRYKIIEGVARGLLYLHEDSRFRIIHRDLKASNILLDINMDPKISDFGIAKLFNMDQTRGITSQVVGTFGYMSPEYALHGNFSTKSDVYSYGVLIFEIIAGRCNSAVFASGTPLDFLSHVWHYWNQGMALKIIDQSLGDQYSSEEALKCIHIGLLCIQENPAQRPSMSSLVAMLTTNSALLDPQMPTFLKQIEV